MNTYRVKKIDLSAVNNVDDYWEAVKRASVHYCTGLAEVRAYCGGSLHRVRAGYAGINENIEYVAERIS